MTAALRNLGRGLFLLTLVEAPWAYGSTRPWTIELLDALLFLAFLLALPDLLARRPRLPFLPLACLTLLCLETGWMTWNARSFHDDAFWQFVPLTQPSPDWPGSWDRAATTFHLQSLLALLAGFIVAADLVTDACWRNRLWLTMALTGLSVVIYGLAQRALAAPSIFWLHEETGRTFFGPFRYHGNAGSFLNLVWPLLVALLIRSFRRPGAYNARALWACGLFLTLAACAVNISRAAGAITLFLLLVAALWLLPYARPRPVARGPWKAVILIALLALFLGTLGLLVAHSFFATHWVQLAGQFNEHNQRLLTQQACLRLLPQAGALGFGAGTFSAVFPYHTLYLGDRIYGFWIHAHEDYLETVIEYGTLGAGLWTLYFFGGLGAALTRALGRAEASVTERVRYAACALALTGLALHSLVDFPLQVPALQLYVVVFIALAWRRPELPRKRGTTSILANEVKNPA